MSIAEEWRVAHRAAITDLLVRLALAQDEHEWDALAECFEPDGVYDHPGGQLTSVADIVDRARNALTPLDASQHLLGTIHVSVDDNGTTAVASTYFQAQHVRHGIPGGDLYTIAGTYRDQLGCRDGRWRIAQRTQVYTWRDGNPDVIRRPPRPEPGATR